jgi:mono/diheme cytochrome c family protein
MTPSTFRPVTAAYFLAEQRVSPTAPVYVVARDNPGILRLLRPGENAGRGGGNAPAPPAGQVVYQQNCQTCHGADRLGIDGNGPALIANGAPRFDAPPSARSSRPERAACRHSHI